MLAEGRLWPSDDDDDDDDGNKDGDDEEKICSEVEIDALRQMSALQE